MLNQFSRTELLVGQKNMEIFRRSRVAVFGIGGVGGYVAEALARSGIGAIDLIDADTVSLTNLNRQIIATHDTIGMPKVDAAEARIRRIAPDCRIRKFQCFYLPETADQFDFTAYDYVVDAVDTVKAKLDIVMQCRAAGTPVISAMGAGNKLDPAAFRVADISKTSVCPLAKVMRRELRKRGVKHLKVVYSEEKPVKPVPMERLTGERQDEEPDAAEDAPAVRDAAEPCHERPRRLPPASIAFAPAAVGLIIASEIVRDLMQPVKEEDRIGAARDTLAAEE